MSVFNLVDGDKPPPEYSEVIGHIIFDIKMKFTRNARFVKNGHLNPDPIDSNVTGDASRDSVRIVFTYTTLNELDIYAANIKSAYLQVPTPEKYYIYCGE